MRRSGAILALFGVLVVLATGASALTSQPVMLTPAEQATLNADVDLIARLRASHASRTQQASAELIDQQKSLLEKLVVKHMALPDPDAYDKLEQVVLKAKAAHAAKLESLKKVQTARASLRKGGLNEVQELVTVLPPSSGPVGRLGHPEKLWGDRILVDQP